VSRAHQQEPIGTTRARAGAGTTWIVAAVVTTVGLWPLAHRCLVASYGIDPWKLGGFAMYTTYSTSLTALFEVTPSGFTLVNEAKLPVEGQRAFADFRAQRSALGTLRSPDDAVRAIYSQRPDLENLLVVVQRMWLDPEDGHIRSSKLRYLFAGGEPVP
jgi:hypothetical protein